MARSIDQLQYGDFQTPVDLARRICAVVAREIEPPNTIVEPTCGTGSFLEATVEAFPHTKRWLGADRNAAYVEQARRCFKGISHQAEVMLSQGDFFTTDWRRQDLFAQPPLLVIGNPPWVTNSSLSTMKSANVPKKFNISRAPGIQALTGGGNFDISESMLLNMVKWFSDGNGALAMLCKSTVARKVLQKIWSDRTRVTRADLFRIDARAEFSASVDAGLLLLQFTREQVASQHCYLHPSLRESSKQSFGKVGRQLVADMARFQRHQHLLSECRAGWRSGIKHDCARVMQLRREGRQFRNGMGERVELESRCLYPMLKASDLTKSRPTPRFWMLVPQTFVGQKTANLARLAPKTWAYLNQHVDVLRARGSVVYRDKPDFSVFGVGEYSFTRWKIGVSGMAKTPRFHVVRPYQRKPTVLDDTCYFLPCNNAGNARELCQILNSRPAIEFFQSQMFPDDKRPITARLLDALDVEKLRQQSKTVS